MIASLLKGVITAWVVASIAFLCLRLSPGDPVERILGAQARAEQIEHYRTQLGLDQSLGQQYRNFLTGLVTLQWGNSLFREKPVLSMIGEAFIPTAKLALMAMVLAMLWGSVIGVMAALKRGSWPDHFIRLASLVTLAFPIFSLGPLLIVLFAIKLSWLPVSELISPKHYVLPLLSLSLPLGSVLSRIVRNQYLEMKNEPWSTVLKAKGLSDLSIICRIYKVCLPTIMNVVSLQLSVILAGAMITETIFDIPGLGRLLLTSIENRDYPLVQGLIIYTSFIYLILYMLTDIFNRRLDPRLR